jgi:hypothetical protein
MDGVGGGDANLEVVDVSLYLVGDVIAAVVGARQRGAECDKRCSGDQRQPENRVYDYSCGPDKFISRSARKTLP